jgi:hypothetical protein
MGKHVAKSHKREVLQAAAHRFAHGLTQFGSTPRIDKNAGLLRPKRPNEFRAEDVARRLAGQDKNTVYSHSQRQ